jgi:2-aminoethylphosphonate-pyruvate transaminase
MPADKSPRTWKDKPLFTPGPLSTSQTVKHAMLRDLGSRDTEFLAVVADVRRRLLDIAGVREPEYTAIPMQGSGTFAIESVLSTVVPSDGKILLIINGSYGKRMAQICGVQNINDVTVVYSEDTLPDPDELREVIAKDDDLTHVAMVHCETTTGIVNPIEDVGRYAKERGLIFIVDAMSSFGAIPINAAESNIDYLISSANKCIEGVPGFAYVIARRKALLAAEGNARTLSLDLAAQLKGFDKNGQFRYTPPTHALLAFHQALVEHEEEGGVAARGARYRANHDALVAGMRELGFEEYLPPRLQGPIITAFLYPEHVNFKFDAFYKKLSDRGYVIYPGKVSSANCFRIGNIGRITVNDVRDLLGAIRQVLADMGVTLEPSVP